jgi:hypothetical protein
LSRRERPVAPGNSSPRASILGAMYEPDMTGAAEARLRALLDRGVIVHRPASIHVDESVDPERIAPGVVIHAGCRLSGAKTAIGPGSVIGEEAPATVQVSLKGGFFSDSTFLDGSSVGSSAHIRPGTLLEEGASVAHCVGLKQTVLLPFVTVGSLVNFCDCLMAGGTGPRDHSEVGSSYIHFNFTPHQDKATASLLGSVPRGVMLDQPPIFLGGQGGLVGPARIGFGTVVAAGVICRQDVLEEGLLYTGRSAGGGRPRKFRNDTYVGAGRVFRNSFHYLGNILALQAWYRVARGALMTGDPQQEACQEGAVAKLETIIDERFRRLGEVADALTEMLEGRSPDSEAAAHVQAVEAYRRLRDAWPALQSALAEGRVDAVGARERERFLSGWAKVPALTPYPEAVASLDLPTKVAGTAWLQEIVDEVVGFLPESAETIAEEGL